MTEKGKNKETPSMPKRHVYWIVAIWFICGIVAGIAGGIFLSAAGLADLAEDYPIIGCIVEMDDSLNIARNKLPITKESQREAVQWRCAKEFVDFNASYEDIFEMEIG